MTSGKRILITGASGFVGANAARRALREGGSVHLLLRAGYQKWRLEEIAPDVHIHEADIEDPDAVHSIVRQVRPDWVLHFAACGAYSSQVDARRMVATNVLGSMSLLDACVEAGVEAFIHTGSSSEYGIKNHPPEETESLDPNSSYAITKAAATHFCRLTARVRNFNAVTLRLYSVYGPYEDPGRLIPALIVHGMRGELPPLVSPAIARDFVYVDDAMDAIWTVAAGSSPRGAVYNVCSGRQTTIGDAVDATRKLMDISVEPVWSSMPDRAWDTDIWIGNGARLAKDHGWQASTPFAEGLAKTLDWFRADPRRCGRAG